MKRTILSAILSLSGVLTTAYAADATSLGTITFSNHGSAHQWTAPDPGLQLSETWTLNKPIRTTTPPPAEILAPNANVGTGTTWTLDFTLLNNTGAIQSLAGVSLEAVTFNGPGSSQPNPRDVTFSLSYQIDGGDTIIWGEITNEIRGGMNNWEKATSVYNFTLPDTPILLDDGQNITFHITPSCASSSSTYGTYVGLKSIDVNGVSVVPEPSAASLGLLALASLALRRRRSR